MKVIMLHYFHGEGHAKSQGSISANDLIQYIDRNGIENLLNAEEWLYKFTNNRLTDVEYCLTFDDNLREQGDIALPVLKHYNKTAFWFVYSSPYFGIVEKLELYRYFRNTFYNSIEEFYADFFRFAKSGYYHSEIEAGIMSFPQDYLRIYSFYSLNDRIFRYLRDRVLGSEKYNELMDDLIKSKGLEISTIKQKLWLREEELCQLAEDGHYLGLHSHTHPTYMAGLSKETQLAEYRSNKEHLESLIGKQVVCMSHPCNSYNQDTLELLQSLGVKYGFRADSSLNPYSNLEIPRIDHADLILN